MGIRTGCPLVKPNEPFLLKYRDALNQDCSNINHVPEEYFETCTFHHANMECDIFLPCNLHSDAIFTAK